MDFNRSSRLHITCARGVTPWLQSEVEALGFKVHWSGDMGLETEGSIADAMRLNLELRTALHVLFEVRHFQCNSPEELYKTALRVPWERMIDPEEYLCVTSSVEHSTINNSNYPNLKLKDAIVDRILRQGGRRPDSGPDRNHVVIHLIWRGDIARIYVNTSGLKLSDRSYRKIPHKAPMKETLAAAVLRAMNYQGQCPLLAPMCGSGTLAIEAALLAQDRAPGLLRSNFGFMHLKGFDAESWQALRRETLKRGKRPLAHPIIATDHDPEAIEAARKNALTAGVDHLIDFQVCDFAETPVPETCGMIVLNPEYGERMGDIKELEETYQRIGDWFKQACPGWTGYIFTGNMSLGKKVGLRTSRRLPFFNARIECRLLEYKMYEGTLKQN
jgi:putative N6-adenine-specific DNA methylase